MQVVTSMLLNFNNYTISFLTNMNNKIVVVGEINARIEAKFLSDFASSWPVSLNVCKTFPLQSIIQFKCKTEQMSHAD